MKINEIKETREVVVRTEYIAEDGKKFATKEDCERYEKSYEATIKASFNKIPRVKFADDPILFPYVCNSKNEVTIIKIRNFEDVKIYNAYVEICEEYWYGWELTQDDIGKVLFLEKDYYDGTYWVKDFNQMIENFNNQVNSMLAELEEKESEN